MSITPKGERSNAVPVWIQKGPTTEDIAHAVETLKKLGVKVDFKTKALIDELITDLKTYV